MKRPALSSTASRTVFIGLVAVVTITILASAIGMLPSGPGGTTSGPNTASVASVDGLRLTLQISATGISLGGHVTINVTETNTGSLPLNQSAASSWGVQGLRMDMCYASIYPFGVAVYPGHYTQQNITTGRPINLYPVVPCPLLIRYISGYYFQPSSSVAVVLPGTGQGVAMASGVVAAGNYTSGNNLDHFTHGVYTVVAGDEWGALAFLYFTVS